MFFIFGSGKVKSKKVMRLVKDLSPIFAKL